MNRAKNDINHPFLNDCNGDMNGDWYVEYGVRNPISGEMERRRHYKGFKKLNSVEERIKHADKLIKEYTKKLEAGEIAASAIVEYEDQLLFKTASQVKYRKRLGPKFSFRVLASKFIVMKKQEVNQDTISTYSSKLRIFNEFLTIKHLENKNVNLIRNDHVVDFLSNVTDENNLSRSSVEKYQQILHTFFKWVIDKERILMENPVLNIPRLGMVVDESAPSLPKKIRKTLKEKIEKEDPQLWLNICFQYYCAIRPSELRLMKLKQINYGLNAATIFNYLSKNQRTETVGIPKQLMRLIKDLKLHEYNQELYIFGENGQPGPKPIGKNAMRNRFNRFRDELNLSKEIKLYSWKHSGATELVESGKNIYKIQRHLRHKSLTTTERYWAKRIGYSGNKIKNKFPEI